MFPGYSFCFTRRAHVQNNGFAIRAGLPYRCGPDLESLSLGDSLRRGAELVLFPGEPRELHLLSVHLKSGCSDKPLREGAGYDRADRACRELTRQIPVLRRWIEQQERAGWPYAVLGDFNRDLLKDTGGITGVWAQLAGPEAQGPAGDRRRGRGLPELRAWTGLCGLYRPHRPLPGAGRRPRPGLLRARDVPPEGCAAHEAVRPLPGGSPGPHATDCADRVPLAFGRPRPCTGFGHGACLTTPHGGRHDHDHSRCSH